MLESMTGFGKAERQLPDKKIVVEIKTLNSKQFDLSLRLPVLYRGRERVFRKLLAEGLARGKIECSLSLEGISAYNKSFNIDKKAVRAYIEEFKAISPGFEEIHYLNLAMKMPEILSTPQAEVDEAEWREIESLIAEAIVVVQRFRMDEGKVLQVEFVCRIKNILKLLDRIGSFEAERRNHIREKLQKALDQASLQIDATRFEQELIYYLEKWDISEEMLRLKNHCNYFSETLQGPRHMGKKLGFITQEIGREVNTLGAKAQHVKIQRIVVQMKDELEKIREQLLNVL